MINEIFKTYLNWIFKVLYFHQVHCKTTIKKDSDPTIALIKMLFVPKQNIVNV
jgi:hypothetical protein